MHPTGSVRTIDEVQEFETIKTTLTGLTTTIHSQLNVALSAEENKDVLWKQRFRYTLSYMVRKSGVDLMDIGFANQYYLLVDFNSETPIILYKDSSLGGIEVSFVVDDYQVDEVVGLRFQLPQEMLSTSVAEGGLGIPFVSNYEQQGVRGVEVLSFLSNIDQFPSASASSTITSLYNSYRARAQAVNDVAAQENLTRAIYGIPLLDGVDIVEESEFETNIRGYLSKQVTLGFLKTNYLLDRLSATIYTGATVLDPTYTTTLYAVGMAPQVGTNLNGSPIEGRDENGITYTLKYPQIKDSQTALK